MSQSIHFLRQSQSLVELDLPTHMQCLMKQLLYDLVLNFLLSDI